MHEAQLHDFSWFATLTYDDSKIPDNGSLYYPHFQSFMRRARKRFGRFRFYMAGEYGEVTHRPHYHACLFGLRLDDLVHYRKSPSGHQLWKSESFDACWSHGLCSLGALTFESAAYTARYVCKKVTGAEAPNHYRRVDLDTGEVVYLTPEFSRMSLNPGIGKKWFDKFHADAFPRDFVVINGTKVRVPKYYSQLLKLLNPFMLDEVQQDRIVKSDSSALERTPERLAVREAVAAAGLRFKSRKL